MSPILGPSPTGSAPPLAFRFSVFFFSAGVVPNPVDILFQKVSGLGMTVETRDQVEGGQQVLTRTLPIRVKHDKVVLERGLMAGSPLSLEVDHCLSTFKFRPSNVLVTLFDARRIPMAAWLLRKAIPVRWHLSDLDANQNQALIETLELACQQIEGVRL